MSAFQTTMFYINIPAAVKYAESKDCRVSLHRNPEIQASLAHSLASQMHSETLLNRDGVFSEREIQTRYPADRINAVLQAL